MSGMKTLKTYLEKMRKLNYLCSILNYDLATTCPEKSLETESDLLNDYMSEIAAIYKEAGFIQAVKDASKEELNAREKKLVAVLSKQISFMEKVDLETYSRWQKAYAKCTEMWRKYKKENDFASWLPYWEKCIEARKEETRLKKTSEMETLYDACLDSYEPGETQKEIDSVFGPLKDFLVQALPQVLEKQKSIAFKPILPHDKHSQEDYSLSLLKAIGYDMGRGVLRESMHPFSDFGSQNDCRVTTEYAIEDWRGNLFSIIHEGGHCIQFQNWPQEHFDCYVNGYATAALCETHSRFYENIIGRSRGFAKTLRKLAEKDLGGEFKEMSDEDFYLLCNKVEPGLIRCDADEFTYSLHIIIRYEIERDLMNGTIECKDVPEVWNKKYKEYLGVDVPSDAQGCMQDIHWSDASIGYFPSYALGNIYGAQILETMKQELPYEEILASGNLDKIREWFAKRDFAYDYQDPKDWIVSVTGKPADPKYFIDYLTKKYLD